MSRTESNGVVRTAARPEGRSRTLIISIHIRVGAVRLEVVVVRDARRRAFGWSVILAAAACRRVTWVGIDEAVRLASHRKASAVKWSL